MSERDIPRGSNPPALHRPVMVREVLQYLDLAPGLTVIDGTVGAGGHGRKIVERIVPGGLLLGLDRDPMMLAFAKRILPDEHCILRQSSYRDAAKVLPETGRSSADRILLDLGLSSDQLADRKRGFGFDAGGPLDLRFDIREGRPAAELLAEADERDLREIFEKFGEERFSGEIARAIVACRNARPVESAADLVSVVESAIPARFQKESRKHPATRIFQALRIAVNSELEHLQDALAGSIFESLAPGGRAVILTFHSLEDRLVKDAFRDEKRWQNLTSKPIAATPAEQRINPRARTVKLRAAVRR